MAGYGHSSATGIDERTLGRVDVLLFDADYADGPAAVEDAWRVAVLAADPHLRAGHERARLDAVQAANLRRDPAARLLRLTTTRHRTALALAFVLAAAAAALVLSPRSGLALQVALLPAGLCAQASLALLSWLEPRRADGSLWGSRLPAVLILLVAGLWLLAASVAVTARWGETDAQRPLAPTSGLALLVVAAAGATVLWWRARRADEEGRQSGPRRLTGELINESDAAEVLAEMDAWWRVAGPAALTRDADRVRRVHVEVLARLAHARLISGAVARRLGGEAAPLRWRERRR
ncbi:MAG: hypothetical protein J0I43_01055 [Microbacterium sp.]|uniref:hypothetical protein n=1 Tax=Microbacterium sp. TaxID=51671 RepID=UPI001AC19278|nr:hypothetical protein [Microbacterium sp.]MBN9175948.1 hypothetical protein [Microbacterium sp.]